MNFFNINNPALWAALSLVTPTFAFLYVMLRNRKQDKKEKFGEDDCLLYRKENDETRRRLESRVDKHHQELKVINRALIVLVIQTGGDVEMVNQLGLMPDVDVMNLLAKNGRT